MTRNGEADGTSPRVLVIVGATTTGKTSLSVAVAKALDGEVISMDSRQVYRGLDIGTDKVGLSERAAVPHHGLDLVNPDERYSAGRFGREAKVWIQQVVARGRLPILAGGTGFFLKALLSPIFDEPSMDEGRRERLRVWLNGLDGAELSRWVQRLDAERAPVAIAGGRQRVQRAIEVPLLTGRPLSEWHRVAAVPEPSLRVTTVLLDVAREELDRRIHQRVDGMMARGFLDEVRGLQEAGYKREDPGLSGTGYREMWDVLFEDRELEDALAAMKAQTRQYARRQLTWFRHQLDPDPVQVDATLPLPEQVSRVVGAITKERAS